MSATPASPPARRGLPGWIKSLGWLLLLVALVAARSGFRQWARADAEAKRAQRAAAEQRQHPVENPNLPKVDVGYILGGFEASPSPTVSPAPAAR